MLVGNLHDEIVVLYDKMHKLYVDYIRFQDVCPTDQSVESTEKLYSIMNKVNDCLMQIAFGGMGAVVFFDTVDLNELYNVVFNASLEVQNQRSNLKEHYTNDTADLVRMYNELRKDFNAVYLAIQDVLQIFVDISNDF